MYKKLFCLAIVLLWVCPVAIVGQQLTWEQFAEDYMSDLSDEESASERQETMEFLEQLHEQPLNLNNCSREDLLQIPYLSSEEADSVLSYVRRYGPVRTVQELQFVRKLDAFHRAVLSFFTTAGEPPGGGEDHGLPRHPGKGRQEAAVNFGVPFYTRQGYRTTYNKKGEAVPRKYAGDRYYAALRYRYRLGDRVDAGLTTEKDEGEAFCSHGNYPFDSYSFYARYRSKGLLNTLLAGDYRIQAGQGLVAGSAFMSNALSKVSSSRAAQQNIYQHGSTDEFYYFRGAAARLRFGHTLLTLFASWRSMDAVTKDSAVTSFIRTGYHRLELERSRKGNLKAAAAGASADVQWRFWHMGATLLYLHYSKPFMRGTRSYQRYNMEGQNFTNGSVHYSYERRRFSFVGESAVNETGAWAFLHELRWNVAYGSRFFLQHRWYDRRYHAPMGKSYAAAGHLSNEHGALAGISLTLRRRLQLLAYADVYRMPAASYYADKASTGYSLNAQAGWQASKTCALQLRYYVKARQESVDSVSFLRFRYKHVVRLQGSYALGPLKMVTTAEGSYWQPAVGKAQRGRALLQRAGLNLQRCALAAWGAWFHTDGYRSGLSACQPSLLYNMAFSTLSGHGYAVALTGEYKCGRHFIAGCKWALTRYTNQKTIGLADREIRKPVKADMMVQLRCLF